MSSSFPIPLLGFPLDEWSLLCDFWRAIVSAVSFPVSLYTPVNQQDTTMIQKAYVSGRAICDI